MNFKERDAAPGEPELLRLDEVAAICRVPLSTVRFWRAGRRFPVVKVGRHPLVRREDLRAFLECGADAKPKDGGRGD